MLDRDSAVANVKGNKDCHAISCTLHNGNWSLGMHHFSCNELDISWETKVGLMIRLKCNKHTNPHLCTLTYLVQRWTL